MFSLMQLTAATSHLVQFSGLLHCVYHLSVDLVSATKEPFIQCSVLQMRS